jgi:hypothetical protein
MTCTNFVSFPARPAGAAGVGTSPPASPPRAWRVASANATVELDVAPSYTAPFRALADGAAWRPGRTRLNVSVGMGGEGGGRRRRVCLRPRTRRRACPCAR